MAFEITTTLHAFPQLNQLRDRYNGVLDVNASWDCVPTSLSDGLTWLTGKQYHALELKEAVYGFNYRGGQAAASYINYCKEQGVSLTPFRGNPAQLVAKIHAELEAGHPVIGTIPSLWGIPVSRQTGNWTSHVVCFAGYGPGALRADNPWIAPTWHDNTDAYWEEELCDDQIWIMQKGEHVGIPTGWKDSENGNAAVSGVLTGPTGVEVTGGFRDHILTQPWSASNIPLSPAVHVTEADPWNPAAGAGMQQIFADYIAIWIQETNAIKFITAGSFVEILEKKIANLESELAAAKTPDGPSMAGVKTLTEGVATALGNLEKYIGA